MLLICLVFKKIREPRQHGLNYGHIAPDDEAIQRIDDHDLWVEIDCCLVDHRQLHFKAGKGGAGRLKSQHATIYPLFEVDPD